MDEKRETALEALAARRWRLALTLTGVMLATYFGFVLLVAFDKPLLGRVLAPGLSLGILLGAAVIAVAWIVTGVYVRWANRTYDVELARLRAAPAAVKTTGEASAAKTTSDDDGGGA